jgi:hypothetical protein
MSDPIPSLKEMPFEERLNNLSGTLDVYDLYFQLMQGKHVNSLGSNTLAAQLAKLGQAAIGLRDFKDDAEPVRKGAAYSLLQTLASATIYAQANHK